MKTVKETLLLISNLLSKPFYLAANFASLIGFLIVFIGDKDKILVSFIFFNFLLLVLIGTLIYTILRLLSNSTTDFESKSTFIKYETLDGNKISYDVFKLIQCKRPVLSHYEYNFKWSGTHLPKVTSELQTVENILDSRDSSIYDKAILRFSKPLNYNESCVINFKADLDDTDKQSKTYISNRISRPVDLIHYRIVLRYRVENSNAVIERRKVDSASQAFTEVTQVPFDKISKSYEYPLLNPELGYIYRIKWNR